MAGGREAGVFDVVALYNLDFLKPSRKNPVALWRSHQPLDDRS